MKEYVRINGVLRPKLTPLLVSAWDDNHASILRTSQKPAIISPNDESCFVEDNMHRWQDRSFKPNNWERI